MTTMSKEELQQQIAALQAQLERLERVPEAIPYNSVNWIPLYDIVRDHIHNIHNKSNDEDEPHYIFEKAIVAVYGNDIWKWYNNQVK